MKIAMRIQNSEYRIQNTFKKLSTFHFSLFTNNNGFTIIETVIVMVIIGILAVVVVVKNPFDSIKLRSAARKVAEDIRYAQKLAISNQTRCGIFFISGTGYRIFENSNTGDPAQSSGDPCSDDGATNFVVDFSASRCSNYSGVTFTVIPTIYFNSLGTPVDSGGGAIGGDQTIRLSHPNAGTKDITITTGTGRVSY